MAYLTLVLIYSSHLLDLINLFQIKSQTKPNWYHVTSKWHIPKKKVFFKVKSPLLKIPCIFIYRAIQLRRGNSEIQVIKCNSGGYHFTDYRDGIPNTETLINWPSYVKQFGKTMWNNSKEKILYHIHVDDLNKIFVLISRMVSEGFINFALAENLQGWRICNYDFGLKKKNLYNI